MAASGVRQGRSARTSRIHNQHDNEDDSVQLDFSKDPHENVHEILYHVVQQSGVSKYKKIAYLNCFVKLLCKIGSIKPLGYSAAEILCCVRVGLIHATKEVRAATLRVIRYLITDDKVLDDMRMLHIDFIVARSLDLCLDNEMERIQAVKLIRKVNQVCPQKMLASMLYPIVAIGNDGGTERDRLLRVSLASLCEIALNNAEIVKQCGGISTILRSILDCHQYPRINESLVATVLYLINHPRTRHHIKCNTDLEQLLAPFTDCHFRYSAEATEGDEKERRFSAAKMAITTIMKSWPGLIRMCRADGSGLQSLVGILYLPNAEIRQGVIELLFDIFHLPLPVWVTDFSMALSSTDPLEMSESWKLTEGFLVEEGLTILPHMSRVRANLVENHLALILFAWITAGILEALIEVIVSCQSHLYVRTTLLLGELLYLGNKLLPAECSNSSHCLPSLVAMASSFTITAEERSRASLALTYLNQIHKVKKRGNVPCSLFLDQLVQQANSKKETGTLPLRPSTIKLQEAFISKRTLSNDEMVCGVIKSTQVLNSLDAELWNWDLILAVLKNGSMAFRRASIDEAVEWWADNRLRNLDDPLIVRFLRQLIIYFKPNNHFFSRVPLSEEDERRYSISGCQLIDFLLNCVKDDAHGMILDWLGDISVCLSEVSLQRAPSEAVFSIQNLTSTLSQDYFLFIGRFSSTTNGEKYLQKSGIYQYLLEISSVATNDCYIKLTLSCLDYSREGMSRLILSKALTSSSESARLYSTKFLRILLRAKVPLFHHWGIEMLVTQLYDQSKAVALAAINVLDEACELECNLSTLIKMRPSFLHLGEQGAMLLCRFLSDPKGYKFLLDANYVINELQKWRMRLNTRYVTYVEDLLNEALTTYERTTAGVFIRRSSKKHRQKDVYVPIHLYGQLTQHKEGFLLLEKQGYILEYFQCIRCQTLQSDEDVLSLKTALWAVGHIGTSCWGIEWLKTVEIIPEIIRLAEECGVFSIRGTSFYILGLLASTRQGAQVLCQFGWESCWRLRSEKWPITENHESLLSMCDTKEMTRPPSIDGQVLFSLGDVRGSRARTSSQTHSEPAVIPDIDEETFIVDRDKPTSANLQRSKTMPARNQHDVHIDNVQLQSQDQNVAKSHYETSAVQKMSPSGHHSSTVINNILSQSSDNTSNLLSDELDTFHLAETTTSLNNSNLSDTSREINLVSKAIVSDLCNRTRGDNLSFQQPVSSHREARSSSSDSSKTSKSRADSFNTDSNTSGVSSYESSTVVTFDPSSLSPVTSTTSINSIGITKRHTASEFQQVHPSTAQRKSANLTRIPSIRKQHKNPTYGIIPSRMFDNVLPDSSITYTMNRDAFGYATLRSLKRQRTSSSDMESEYGLSRLYEDDDFRIRSQSIGSQKSIDTHSAQSSAIFHNVSFTSVAEAELHQNRMLSRLGLFQDRQPHPLGGAEFLGLSIPVDVNMIFEVNEGEDRRSHSNVSTEDSGIASERSLPRSISQSDDDVMADHSPDRCLACYRILPPVALTVCIQEVDEGAIPDMYGTEHHGLNVLPTQDDTSLSGQVKGSRSRGGSYNEASSTTGSITSSCSTDSAPKKLCEDSPYGRKLIRKELVRFVINMGSSVGMKSSEQGLLRLKQKFPKVFQDLCLYSEICCILSNYSFRLGARRFIQELFDELDIAKLLEEPQAILKITSLEVATRMTTISQDIQAEFDTIS